MIQQIKKPVFTFAAIISSSIILSGCIVHVNAKDHGNGYHDDVSDYSTTNKRVNVPDNTNADKISSVNGRLKIGDHVSADRVTNVNGKIDIGDHVAVDGVKSVNGKVDIGSHFKSSDDVSTVNGAIEIQENGTVDGSIKTVNGTIKLNGVEVKQDIVTKNGSVYLKQENVVRGDIIFEEINKQNFYSWGNKKPTLSIDADTKVYGDIILKREVNLDIDNDELLAKVKREY